MTHWRALTLSTLTVLAALSFSFLERPGLAQASAAPVPPSASAVVAPGGPVNAVVAQAFEAEKFAALTQDQQLDLIADRLKERFAKLDNFRYQLEESIENRGPDGQGVPMAHSTREVRRNGDKFRVHEARTFSEGEDQDVTSNWDGESARSLFLHGDKLDPRGLVRDKDDDFIVSDINAILGFRFFERHMPDLVDWLQAVRKEGKPIGIEITNSGQGERIRISVKDDVYLTRIVEINPVEGWSVTGYTRHYEMNASAINHSAMEVENGELLIRA